jgi:hypothetical protein
LSLAVPHAPSRRPDRRRHVDRSNVNDDVHAANDAPRDEIDACIEKESLARLGDTINIIIIIFRKRRTTRCDARTHARRRYAVRDRRVRRVR